MDTGDGVIPLLIANRPILKVADATMRGYRRLQDQEDAFRVETFIQHPELVGCWIHYLDLFDAAIETQNANPLDPDPPTPEDDYALQLQTRLFALAGGTAKLLFDAACAGLYVQAYMLCRHLLETWVRIVYVMVQPEMADRWFDEKPDDPSHKPPSDTSMHRVIRKSPPTIDTGEVLNMVIENIRRCDKMAHPSEMTLEQTVSQQADRIQIGGNYSRKLAIGSLHEGAEAFRILLQAWERIAPQSDDWQQELAETINIRRRAVANRE